MKENLKARLARSKKGGHAKNVAVALGFLGGLVLIAGPFLPWCDESVLWPTGLSLTQVVWMALVAGVVAQVASFACLFWVRGAWFLIPAGIIGFLTALYGRFRVVEASSHYPPMPLQPGIGIIVTMVGAILVMAAGLAAAAMPKRPPSVGEPPVQRPRRSHPRS